MAATEYELYLGVLPIIHIATGETEQVMTLLTRENATEFFIEDVDSYILIFKAHQHHLIGGHVTHYTLDPVDIGNDRCVVKVTQHVS